MLEFGHMMLFEYPRQTPLEKSSAAYVITIFDENHW